MDLCCVYPWLTAEGFEGWCPENPGRSRCRVDPLHKRPISIIIINKMRINHSNASVLHCLEVKFNDVEVPGVVIAPEERVLAVHIADPKLARAGSGPIA